MMRWGLIALVALATACKDSRPPRPPPAPGILGTRTDSSVKELEAACATTLQRVDAIAFECRLDRAGGPERFSVTIDEKGRFASLELWSIKVDELVATYDRTFARIVPADVREVLRSSLGQFGRVDGARSIYVGESAGIIMSTMDVKDDRKGIIWRLSVME